MMVFDYSGKCINVEFSKILPLKSLYRGISLHALYGREGGDKGKAPHSNIGLKRDYQLWVNAQKIYRSKSQSKGCTIIRNKGSEHEIW